MSESPEQASCPVGEDESKAIRCLLLTACALLLFIPPLWISLRWEHAFRLLVSAAPLPLTGWWLARRRGCARQEAQARFLLWTVLYCFAIPLLRSFLPEVELTGGGLGRVFDALLHLDVYGLRLILQLLQLGFALLACVRLLWSIITLLTRRPLTGYLKFRSSCFKVCIALHLLFFVLLGGVVACVAFFS